MNEVNGGDSHRHESECIELGKRQNEEADSLQRLEGYTRQQREDEMELKLELISGMSKSDNDINI